MRRTQGISSVLTGIPRVSFLSILLISLGACGSDAGGGNGSGGNGDETPTMLFSANDGVTGKELWKTDGTPEGTVLVKDINPGAGDSSPTGFTQYNGALYFQANDGVNGRELWKTDGTTDGTVLVKDINPAGVTDKFSNFIFYNDLLFFTAQGRLWQTDGSPDGTVLVKDIGTGSLTSFNGYLYFGAFDANGDGGLWRTDGTEAGTVLVRLLDPVAGGGDTPVIPRPGMSVVANGLLFFRTGNSVYENHSVLWKSDGTAEGTTKLRGFLPPRVGRQVPVYLIAFNDAVYFNANDGVNGYEVWKSDGTVDGTVMVKDINPDSSVERIPSYPYGPYGFTVFNDALYFNGNDGVNGTELWKTDGTPEGTIMVKDINPTNDAYARYPTASNNVLYFQADDSVNGAELWKTDGTEAGTVLVKDIDSRPGASSYPSNLSVFGNP